MCTCLDFKSNSSHYFGRTLDLEFHYHEEICVTPRNYTFVSPNSKTFKNKYALIGTAFINDNYPLYYEASNEVGLAMSGLNFPFNAHYFEPKKDKLNLTPFELIPYILGNYKTVKEVKEIIKNLNITNVNFKSDMPLSPLHFMLSDNDECIVLESTKDGLKIYQNEIGVMTNNPTFDEQLLNLENYKNLTNKFKEPIAQKEFCVGLGAINLPGDYSSKSRFIKTAFLNKYATRFNDETKDVNQFFHILDSVSMIDGAVLTKNNESDITYYTSCINITKGIYYYKTYDNNQISSLKLTLDNMNKDELTRIPLNNKTTINNLN